MARRTTKPKLSKQIRRDLKARTVKEDDSPPGFIPTGSTLLNLALSNRVDGGWPLGKIVNLIGDSSSGKTLLALTAFAEMAHDEKFDDYNLIYDDAEQALEFNLPHLFGEATASRIRPPATGLDDSPLYSDTVQDFHANLDAELNSEIPLLYVLDSFDALTSDEEIEKVQTQMKARREGTKAAGDMGMSKPKKSSQLLRMIKGKLKGTRSCLIVISQTRDNINPMTFAKKRRSGGRALQFYSTHEIWTAVGKKMKLKVSGKSHSIGLSAIVKITKNKVTGRHSQIEIPLLYDYGVDDNTSMIDFLLEYKKVRKRRGKIVLEGKSGTTAALVKLMEKDKHFYRRVRRLVGKTWKEIDEALKPKRRRRYE